MSNSASARFPNLSRRDWLRLTACGTLGISQSGWLAALADETAKSPNRKRSCILLWMTGGPSQTDTFDLKPGHANGGEVKPIDTSVPGIQISEHLPLLAQQMEHFAIVRSMSTKEGDHARATYLMRTGYLPQGPVQFPTIGSVWSKEIGKAESELPNFVSVAPFRFLSPGAFGPGFLGPRYAPLVVGDGQPGGNTDYEKSLQVKNLAAAKVVAASETDARLDLLSGLESDFLKRNPGVTASSHRAAYLAAVRMMRSDAVKAFELTDEADALRDAYGRNQFGQGCLLARRLVERGVPFVEVSLNGVPGGAGGLGWDTHQGNFEGVKSLCGVLDPAWSTLLKDLKERGLLDSTLVIWMGEFGRTPNINAMKGRDHFPNAWSTVLCGGGIRGGQVVGKTSDDGMKVDDRPVATSDLLATACLALGIDPMKQNMSNVGRPVRVADPEASPIHNVLA
ncbi:MAG: DUF1501 domain-containing protein [Planctomycetota bacterium]|nr:DUF1501 domain-containing protein [Planctomycetota bacterium]